MGNIVLGWKVTNGLEPEYWLNSTAQPGAQNESDLITVPNDKVGANAIIIGQSGSGKSFLLGRLIEELLINTKAKCVIIDPNSDFRLINNIASKDIWKEANYNALNRTGKLPHEKSRRAFKTKWDQVTKCVFSNIYSYDDTYKPIELWWPSLSSEIIAGEEDNPSLRSQLYHCHEFVKAIGHVSALKPKTKTRKDHLIFEDPIQVSEKFWKIWEGNDPSHTKYLDAINTEFKAENLNKNVSGIGPTTINSLGFRWFPIKATSRYSPDRISVSKMLNRLRIARWMKKATTALQYVTPDAARYYFGKANEYRTSDILTNNPRASYLEDAKLSVFDLPSLQNKNTRILVINAILEDIWNQAKSAWQDVIEEPEEKDNRVPTFVIVDEAHNFIPAEPRDKTEYALREQFRTIASEGRKFGIFLIIASQRPDKLDPLVLSECENKVLMKIDSYSVLESTSKILGFEDINQRTLGKCVEFGMGCALISGKWTYGEPKLLYAASRRTKEGGRNLRSEHWASI